MYFSKFEDSDRIEKLEITSVRFVPMVRPPSEDLGNDSGEWDDEDDGEENRDQS